MSPGNTEHQQVNFPAAYDEVIAVGSINAEGKLAELTSTGTELELLAPGEQIYTTGLFYGTIGVSGTSIATAQVTGTAALLKAKDKTKSADFIRGLLRASSKEVEGTNAGLIDYKYALEIYDEYAKSYTKGEDTDDKFENEKKIPDYSDDAEAVVVGLWSRSMHDEIISDAAGGESYDIPAKYLTLVSTICNDCDKTYKANSQYGSCLHGGRNYYATLKFLWAFAKKINTTSSISKTKVKQYKTECLNLFNKDKFIAAWSYDTNMANTDYNCLVKLANITETVVNKHMNDSILKNKNKKYIVFGLIMHVLGDVTAHRTIVPKCMTKNATKNFSNKNAFDLRDFSAANWTKLVDAVNEQRIDFTSISGWGLMSKHVGYNSNIAKYEDNIKVIDNRWLFSETMVDYFLKNFKKGFKANIFNSVYKNVDLINMSIYKKAL